MKKQTLWKKYCDWMTPWRAVLILVPTIILIIIVYRLIWKTYEN